jgi:hypothetical protein
MEEKDRNYIKVQKKIKEGTKKIFKSSLNTQIKNFLKNKYSLKNFIFFAFYHLTNVLIKRYKQKNSELINYDLYKDSTIKLSYIKLFFSIIS